MLHVSILLPVYNAERYLAEAIESVLNQTYGAFELILINDGSTDGAEHLMRTYAGQDPRIKVISHPNMGMGNSLNQAIEIAASDWLVRMDADDVMMPTRLERQIEFMESHGSTMAVFGSLVYYIDESGKNIGRSAPTLTRDDEVTDLVNRNELIGLHHPTVMMRKSVVKEVGGYRSHFWPADDIDLWNRIAERGYGILVQPEYLLKYRIHGSSISVAAARTARQKVRWVKACMQARRARTAEPSWETFLAISSQQPFIQRLNQGRKDAAKVLYKTAALHYAKRNYPMIVPYLVGAACLQPGYVLRQVMSKHGGTVIRE